MAKNTQSQEASGAAAPATTKTKRTRTPRQLTDIEKQAKAQWVESIMLAKFIYEIPRVSAWGLGQIEKAVQQRWADLKVDVTPVAK